MSIIYETRGRAREYFELAANLYGGCGHACRYCYGATVTHKDPTEFFRNPRPRDNVIDRLETDARRLGRNNETRHILLSFVTDPYQPLEERLKVTRRAIEILHYHSLNVAILTKGGFRATRDFDLLTNLDLFGVTLTFMDPTRSRTWEPGAALPIDRMKSLEDAHARGIPTWVSLEPVIEPVETLALIDATAGFVDHYKVGTLNYPDKLPPQFQVQRIDWRKFALVVVEHLDGLGANYYIKKDLARYIGRPEGIQEGVLIK